MVKIKRIIVLLVLFVMGISMLCSCSPTHECKSICEDCGLCTNQLCSKEVCINKCQGHILTHSCQSICISCGKCTDEQCAESVCAYKCSCKLCEKCGKCYYDCKSVNCNKKCTCEVPLKHFCRNVCDKCGLCRSNCDECYTHCDGNHPNSEWELYVDDLIGVSYIYTVPTLSEQQQVDFCNLYQEYVDSDRENNYDGGSGDIVLVAYYGKIGSLDYLCVGYKYPMPYDPSHDLTIEGIKIYGSRRQYVFVSDGKQLVRIDHAYEQNLVTIDNVRELSYMILANQYYAYTVTNHSTSSVYDPATTFQINIVGTGFGGTMFYVGEKIQQHAHLTPKELRLRDINYDYKDMQGFCEEKSFYFLSDNSISSLIDKLKSVGYQQYFYYYNNLLYQAYLHEFC